MTINPSPRIYFDKSMHELLKLNSRLLYNQLIADKTLLPRGFLTNWCNELQLTNDELKHAFREGAKNPPRGGVLIKWGEDK